MRKPSITTLFVLITSLTAGSTASTQTITSLVLEGDPVTGVGNVTRIDNVAVNNDGNWLVEADTDLGDADRDQVLLGPAGLVHQEGDSLPNPAGSAIGSFDAINLNGNGDTGWNLFLDGTSGSSDDSGIFFNTNLLVQESDTSSAPKFSPGTVYVGFFDAKLNNADRMLVVASVDDPNIPTTVDRALMIFELDGAGNLVSESVLAKEGDVPAAQTDSIADFGTGPHESAINDAGQVLYFVDLLGSTVTDGCIYLDGTLLAQEGTSSPVAARNYESLSSRGLDLNNNGDYVFKADIDGSTSDDALIEKNGSVFVREGDNLPAIGAFTLTGFGSNSGPVQIADDGRVLWFGDWDDPDTDIDTGLFLDDELLVQEGVTTIGGSIVDDIASVSDAFAMSDNGRWIIFEATLAGGVNGAFLIELPATAVGSTPLASPTRLLAPTPNPFVASTTLGYSLARRSRVELGVFDASGRLVATLDRGLQPAGRHDIAWNGLDERGRQVPGGVYFLRLEADGRVSRGKVVRLR